MKISDFSYSQLENENEEWKFNNFKPGKINLLVGKNASGKSMVLTVIKVLCDLISTKRKVLNGNWDVEFENGKDKIRYVLKIEKTKVIEEKYFVNNVEKLTRDHTGIGTIYTTKLDKNIEFQAPSNELALVLRRDNIQHDFFEPLHTWSQCFLFYQFGTLLGKNALTVVDPLSPMQFDPKNQDLAALAFIKGKEDFGDDFVDSILGDMKKIGYEILELGVEVPRNIPITNIEKAVCLWIKEKGIEWPLQQFSISQGMFRVLSLTIQLNYLIRSLHPGTILIDDIGEGLDFERSCSFINLIVEKSNEANAQLIISTNDRFIMNTIPLEAWHLIIREGHGCRFVNYENSKDIFEKFKFTGLSNFDFFSNKYYFKNN